MKLFLSVLSVFLLNNTVFSQQITGKELLDKTLTYHDPNGNWATFNGVLNVTMETPNGSNRDSEIKINLPKEYFYVKTTRDTLTTEYILNKEDCNITLNGENNLSDETLKKHRLSCKRANMYKNYYTYLYGLPMKLNDPGTNIHEKVERKNFKGKDYLVLKATYDEAVGNDVWYFYFNPKTYAMEVYQFFHIDKDTNKETGGEYILLSDEEIINGIKMPKKRAWYTNKDNKLLGTDILKQ